MKIFFSVSLPISILVFSYPLISFGSCMSSGSLKGCEIFSTEESCTGQICQWRTDNTCQSVSQVDNCEDAYDRLTCNGLRCIWENDDCNESQSEQACGLGGQEY